MSRVLEFRLGELLGVEPRCDHLDEAELIEVVEGRLLAGRLDEFLEHAGQCAACADLLDDVETFGRLTSAGVTIPSELRAFRDSDRRIRQRLGLGARRRRIPRLALWLVPAITAALLAVLLWAPWQAPAGTLIGELQPMPLVPPPTVRTQDLSQIWLAAEADWNSRRFGRAAVVLESGTALAPDDASLWFYLGHARLLDGDAAAALEALQRADALAADIPSEHTRWMLAAALDRLERRGEACAALRSVAAIGGSRAGDARRIVVTSCADLPRP